MKTTAVVESLSTIQPDVLFQRLPAYFKIIKDNCEFQYYFNKTDVKLSVLDGGHEMILANWPNTKYVICNDNHNFPVKIPSHSYVLLKISVLCNCAIEAENNFLLESIAACP